MHGAKKSPGLRQKLSNGGSLHGGEELTSVDAAEVREVAQEVDPLGHDRESGDLKINEIK